MGNRLFCVEIKLSVVWQVYAHLHPQCQFTEFAYEIGEQTHTELRILYVCANDELLFTLIFEDYLFVFMRMNKILNKEKILKH